MYMDPIDFSKFTTLCEEVLYRNTVGLFRKVTIAVVKDLGGNRTPEVLATCVAKVGSDNKVVKFVEKNGAALDWPFCGPGSVTNTGVLNDRGVQEMGLGEAGAVGRISSAIAKCRFMGSYRVIVELGSRGPVTRVTEDDVLVLKS